jgi:LysM repeat protein
MWKTARWKRLLVQTAITCSALFPAAMASAETITVKAGDTLGNIAFQHQLSVEHLMIANHLKSHTILAGSSLYIPPKSAIYQIKSGDTLWKIAARFQTSIRTLKEINRLTSDTLFAGDKLLVPLPQAKAAGTQPSEPTVSDKPWVEMNTYTVKKGDTPWTVSLANKIPMEEFLRVNHLSPSAQLQVGQKVKIPVHHIPVMKTPGQRYGEYLDWFKAAQYLFPINAVAKVTDFHTGKSFQVKRTIGAFHSDTEPLTAADAAIIKQIWGGNYSWSVRPVIVEVNGRKIAASMSSMPHSIDTITGNNFPGHFDIHFRNSLRHKDSQIDTRHQEAVKIAAGLQQ